MSFIQVFALRLPFSFTNQSTNSQWVWGGLSSNSVSREDKTTNSLCIKIRFAYMYQLPACLGSFLANSQCLGTIYISLQSIYQQLVCLYDVFLNKSQCIPGWSTFQQLVCLGRFTFQYPLFLGGGLPTKSQCIRGNIHTDCHCVRG